MFTKCFECFSVFFSVCFNSYFTAVMFNYTLNNCSFKRRNIESKDSLYIFLHLLWIPVFIGFRFTTIEPKFQFSISQSLQPPDVLTSIPQNPPANFGGLQNWESHSYLIRNYFVNHYISLVYKFSKLCDFHNIELYNITLAI